MAISGDDQTLIDADTGVLLAPQSTVIVPEVLGALAYDIMYDEDAAIEYGDAQGVALEDPDAEGIPVNELADEPRGYLAIDLDSGYVCHAEDLLLIDYDDTLSEDELLERAQAAGTVPSAPTAIRDIEGMPFASITE